MRRASLLVLLTASCAIAIVHAAATPVRSKTGMVISASEIASQVGARVLKDGGNGMNAQEAVDAGRFHHQWLPDRITYERFSLSPDTLAVLRSKGHEVLEGARQGTAEVIVYNAVDDMLEGGVDRRQPDGGAAQ